MNGGKNFIDFIPVGTVKERPKPFTREEKLAQAAKHLEEDARFNEYYEAAEKAHNKIADIKQKEFWKGFKRGVLVTLLSVTALTAAKKYGTPYVEKFVAEASECAEEKARLSKGDWYKLMNRQSQYLDYEIESDYETGRIYGRQNGDQFVKSFTATDENLDGKIECISYSECDKNTGKQQGKLMIVNVCHQCHL